MVKQIGVELGCCVEAISCETGLRFRVGIVTKIFPNGRVRVATPGKTYEVASTDYWVRDEVPTSLIKFTARKKKELGLTS